jgi:uncharacterized protein (TIGR03437 family)
MLGRGSRREWHVTCKGSYRSSFGKHDFQLKTLMMKAVLIAVAGFVATFPAVGSQITLPSQSVTAGTSVLVTVTFTSQQSSVSGIEFDVQFDNSVMSLGAILGDTATNAGKGMYTVSIAPNRKRILVSGNNQGLIADGTLISFLVNTSPTAAAGTYALNLSNLAATDPSAQSIALSGVDGLLTLQAEGQGTPLRASGVRSAASWLSGSVAPGEIITLLGAVIGPTPAQVPDGAPSSTILGGTSVMFDGTAAPLLYAGPDQINAVVPFSVSGQAATQMQLLAQGKVLSTLSVPVVPAAPAIFTIDSTGVGEGAILNQDFSLNSYTNPAVKGSVISIYATGGGQSDPLGVDGQVAGAVLSHPLLAVMVKIGGVTSQVLYAGAAPGLISGALQINAVVPESVLSGPSVSVLVAIGSATSQPGVTVAVQ